MKRMNQHSVEAFCALLFAVCVLVALMLLTGCGKAQDSAPDVRPVVQGQQVIFPSGSPGIQRIGVETVAAPADRDVVLPGRLTWDEDRTVRVYPPFAGRVSRILVQVGATVHAGQALAEVASPDFGQAQADARKAQADLALSSKALDRARDLNTHGVLSTKDLQQAEADQAKARAEADRAHERLRAYGQSVDAGTFTLKSPIAGTVVERNINPGQEIRTDTSGPPPLFVISDPTRLWVQLDASEAQLAYLKPGMQLVISSNQFPDDAFSGELMQVADFIDPTSRTLKVRGDVPNAQRTLKAEMFVNARIRVPKADQPMVDARAVFLSGNRTYVFQRTAPATFTRRAVRVGPQNDGRMPVLSGLREGDEVVVTGNLFLEQMVAAVRSDTPPETTAAAKQE
jgi:cobalt-zinc-cadmium efflux system membrane fusion protein